MLSLGCCIGAGNVCKGINNKEDSILKKVFYISFPLIPLIVDFILSLLNFSKDAKAFFIIKFILYAILFIFCLILYGYNNTKYNSYMDITFSQIFLLFYIILIFLFEIISLILFIKSFKILSIQVLIGYFAHFGIFILFSIYKCKGGES